MTTIPIVDEDTATGAVADAYADYRAHFGRDQVPGILKCFATHPPLLEQMIALASTLLFTESHLNRKVKEMIATTSRRSMRALIASTATPSSCEPGRQ